MALIEELPFLAGVQERITHPVFDLAWLKRSLYNCTIDLDCEPGAPRPGDLIGYVLAGTGLPMRDPVAKVFGNWTWRFDDCPMDFIAAKPTLKTRIESLYHERRIRYGSW